MFVSSGGLDTSAACLTTHTPSPPDWVAFMTYGRSIFKALEMFRIDKTRWPELAANRSAWRETLRTGVAPPAFWPPAPPPQAKPLSRTKLPRSSAQQTQAKMNESLRRERLT